MILRKKERSVAFKIRQNAFLTRAGPGPAGEVMTLPRPPTPLGRGHPSSNPPHSALNSPAFGAGLEIPQRCVTIHYDIVRSGTDRGSTRDTIRM